MMLIDLKEKAYIILLIVILAGTGCDLKNKKQKSSGRDMNSMSSGEGVKADIDSGKSLFIQYCSACHGNDGRKGLNGAKDLSKSNREVNKIIKRISKGKGNMPSFKETLTDQQMIDIANYLDSDLKSK